MARIALLVGCLLPAVCALGDEPRTSPLADVFGARPALWGMRLSPDGTKTSQIVADVDGTMMITVIDFADGAARVVATADAWETVDECGWASVSRLVCTITAVLPPRRPPIGVDQPGVQFPEFVQRLVAVDHDGSNPVRLLERRRTSAPGVVDYLIDDPDHVLTSRSPDAVEKTNVYDGESDIVEKARQSAIWISDGAGVPRLQVRRVGRFEYWYAREGTDDSWNRLERRPLDRPPFLLPGLTADGNEILYVGSSDGRQALFAREPRKGGSRRLVFADPTFDVQAVEAIGPRRTLAYAVYDNGRGQHVFDEHARRVREELETAFPDAAVYVVDRSSNAERYLALVRTPVDAGSYYVYDVAGRIASLVTAASPSASVGFAVEERAVRYASSDGTEVPGYVFAPADPKEAKGAVVLPLASFVSPRVPGYDFVAQFLAANGYAVLRSAHRGSTGYGRDWLGDGPFANWREAVQDVTAGASWLASAGLADPAKICVAAWAGGAHIAFLAAAENPELFRCVALVSGLTEDTADWAYTSGKAPDDDGDVLRRARDLSAPVFIAHGLYRPISPRVSFDDLATALASHGKPPDAVAYAPSNAPAATFERRTDALTRLAEFLDAHLGEADGPE